jgi:hypothetical protein
MLRREIHSGRERAKKEGHTRRLHSKEKVTQEEQSLKKKF